MIILDYLKAHWEIPTSATLGSGSSLLFTGFNVGGILQAVVVGTILFVITSALKKMFSFFR